MIYDNLTAFANATALNTGAAGTYLLGNQIDLEDVRDIGDGQQVYVVGVVTTTATSGGSATAQFKLASDASAAIDTGGAATEHFTTPAFAVANMTAGTVLFQIALPLEGSNAYERFLGILQVTGTAAFTAGAVSIFLTTTPRNLKTYPDGQN